MNTATELFNSFLHEKQKAVAVTIVEKHILLRVATQDNVIKSTGIIYTLFASHVDTIHELRR